MGTFWPIGSDIDSRRLAGRRPYVGRSDGTPDRPLMVIVDAGHVGRLATGDLVARPAARRIGGIAAAGTRRGGGGHRRRLAQVGALGVRAGRYRERHRHRSARVRARRLHRRARGLHRPDRREGDHPGHDRGRPHRSGGGRHRRSPRSARTRPAAGCSTSRGRSPRPRRRAATHGPRRRRRGQG